ncbi:phosphopantetheine-binding protein [Dactylosporangium sp. NPDC049742]|uniref:phosphopantetheine-binding protein n=1 Tax=Dactylosporangium sp. NPDC049742 TaxID=3154737 RepID=UPI0034346BA1
MSLLDGADATEAAVAKIWTELGLRPESLDDDFFALGGQSLTLVAFLARVQETLGVEVPVDTLFDEDLTVAYAARVVTDAQLAALPPDELAAVLAELDGMSDAEVAALVEAD